MTKSDSVPTTQALFSALKELREDPSVAAVLAGAPDTASGYRLPLRTPTTSSSAAANSSPPRGTTATADSYHSGGGTVQHDAELFYRDRDAARESVGIRNWLQKHRDELSNSEARRVDTRLRTEQLFAQSQLDVESVRLDRSNPSSASLIVPVNGGAADSSNMGLAASSLDVEHAMTQTPGFLTGGPTSSTTANSLKPHHSSPLRSGSVSQPRRTTISLSPPQSELQTPGAGMGMEAPLQQHYAHRSIPSRIVVLNTEDYFGPIDGDANYAQKRATSNRANGYEDEDPEFGGEDPWLRDAAKDEVTALEEAVEHRDRTIRRLQRQLSEDRAYFEQQIASKDSELNELRAASESRVTALRSQIDELVTLRANRNAEEVSLEDLRAKLTTVQASYRDSVNALKQEAADKLEAMEIACQRRIDEILDQSEEAVRQAKETFRTARMDTLTTERQQILDYVSREQDLRLREVGVEIEARLRDSVLQVVIKEIEEAFQRNLATHVIPALRKQLTADALVDASVKLREECEGLFAQKLQSLRVTLLGELEVAELRFTEQYLKEAEQQGTLHPPNLAVAAAMDQRVAVVQQIVAEVKAEEQRQDQLEALHQEKMAVYRKRIVQTNASVEHEESFGKAIQEQLRELQGSGGVPSMAVPLQQQQGGSTSSPSPSRGGMVVPPFLAQAEREAARNAVPL